MRNCIFLHTGSTEEPLPTAAPPPRRSGRRDSSLQRRQGHLTFGEDGSLPRELLQDLGCSGEPIPALPNADVKAQLADAELSHGVLFFTLVLLRRNAGRNEHGSQGNGARLGGQTPLHRAGSNGSSPPEPRASVPTRHRAGRGLSRQPQPRAARRLPDARAALQPPVNLPLSLPHGPPPSRAPPPGGWQRIETKRPNPAHGCLCSPP